jgi:hypothetical protein
MLKFIVTAKKKADIINLMLNTASVDLHKVEWDANSVTRSDEDAYCTNRWELDDSVSKKEWDRVDEAIMSGDVPTGSMVVVCDEKLNPLWGYVCGNGQEWFKVYLTEEIQVAILKQIHPKARYFVVGGFMANVFETKTDIGMWLEEGFNACEGSEQRRYASMMNQLDAGKTVIDYDA